MKCEFSDSKKPRRAGRSKKRFFKKGHHIRKLTGELVEGSSVLAVPTDCTDPAGIQDTSQR